MSRVWTFPERRALIFMQIIMIHITDNTHETQSLERGESIGQSCNGEFKSRYFIRQSNRRLYCCFAE